MIRIAACCPSGKMTDMERRQNAPEEVTWTQWHGTALLATVVLIGLEFMVYRALASAERGDPGAHLPDPHKCSRLGARRIGSFGSDPIAIP